MILPALKLEHIDNSSRNHWSGGLRLIKSIAGIIRLTPESLHLCVYSQQSSIMPQRLLANLCRTRPNHLSIQYPMAHTRMGSYRISPTCSGFSTKKGKKVKYRRHMPSEGARKISRKDIQRSVRAEPLHIKLIIH